METTTPLHYVTGISHIGIAVPDIEVAAKQYALLGFQALHEGVHREEAQQVQAKMMGNGAVVIELLSPLEKDAPSPVDGYMSNKAYTMYHIAYNVSDFDAQVALLRENRFVPVGEARVSSVTGKRSIFMFNRKMGVLELSEE